MMKTQTIARLFAVPLLIVTATEMLHAHGGGGDIAIFSTDEKTDIGFAVLDDDDINHISFDPDVNVFQAVLIPNTPSVLPPIPYAIGSTEPGFDANETELPPFATLTVDTLDLRYWNGAGDVSFGPASGVHGGYAPQPGTVFADGGYHSHPLFGLCVDGLSNCADAPVPNGVYLAELGVRVEGLEDADPYYLVALVDDHLYTGDPDMDAENGEAVGELVRNYLADPANAPAPVFDGKDYTYYADAIAFAQAIPEPAAGALAALVMLVTLMSRAGRRV